jgi:rubrerythrin
MSTDTMRVALSPRLLDDIATHDGVCAALQTAIELEHSTIPAYLYALFSLKPGAQGAPGVNGEIARLIESIVNEEMGHMALACNILNAIGGSPVIDSRAFVPRYPGHLPGGVEGSLVVGLERFSKEHVRKVFMTIERPDEPLVFNARRRVALLEAAPEEPITIGDFYRTILASLEQLDPDVWVTDHSRQVHSLALMPEVTEVVDLASAATAIDVIVDQGEGTTKSPIDPATGAPAHFYRFEEIVKGFALVPTGEPPPAKPFAFTGDPIPFDPAGVYPLVSDPRAAHYPAGSPARTACNSFNYTYTALLRSLHATFNGAPSMLGSAVGLMMSLQDQASALVTVPLGDGTNAGPSFEYQPVNPVMAV